MENIPTKDSTWIDFLTHYTFPALNIHCSSGTEKTNRSVHRNHLDFFVVIRW
jgi:hypothetical protein